LEQRGYRFGQLATLKKQLEEGSIKTVILVHDERISSVAEVALLKEILQLASTSIVFEVLQSELGQLATLWIPMTSYVEESDFVINLRGEICRYQKALKAPDGCSTIIQWLQILRTSTLATTSS
jgi:NADH dehydrogenase/NADH:ubiquinone oxidoreductase subunit G